MYVKDFVNEKYESGEVLLDTTVIVQSNEGETISSMSVEDLLDSDADAVYLEVYSDDIDDDDNLVVVVE